MGLHLYFGDNHRKCPICGYNLPIEYFVIVGKILFCRDCAELVK